MKHRAGNAALFGVACLLLSAAVPVRHGFDASLSASNDTVELALFPTGPWVRPLANGRTTLAADLAWLQAVQYYGKHRATDRSYPYIETLFQTLTDFDPRFVNAYIFGALVLAEDEQNLPKALALLERGRTQNPESWWLVFETGFLHYMHARDFAEAGFWFASAAKMEGAPDWIARMAAYATTRGGESDVAFQLWKEIYDHTDNDEIRRVAAQYLDELTAARRNGTRGTDGAARTEPGAQSVGTTGDVDRSTGRNHDGNSVTGEN